jgi:predicted RNase H-like HicB family nuclease
MCNVSAVIGRDPDTWLFVGFVPGFPGAPSQGATLDEFDAKLRDIIAKLLEDGEPVPESESVGGCRTSRSRDTWETSRYCTLLKSSPPCASWDSSRCGTVDPTRNFAIVRTLHHCSSSFGPRHRPDSAAPDRQGRWAYHRRVS